MEYSQQNVQIVSEAHLRQFRLKEIRLWCERIKKYRRIMNSRDFETDEISHLSNIAAHWLVIRLILFSGNLMLVYDPENNKDKSGAPKTKIRTGKGA